MVPSKHVVGTSGCTDHPLVTYCMSEYVSVHMCVFLFYLYVYFIIASEKRRE